MASSFDRLIEILRTAALGLVIAALVVSSSSPAIQTSGAIVHKGAILLNSFALTPGSQYVFERGNVHFDGLIFPLGSSAPTPTPPAEAINVAPPSGASSSDFSPPSLRSPPTADRY